MLLSYLSVPKQSDFKMIKPNYEELREAFQAGFDTIDEGEGFYPGFHAFLEYHGYSLHEDVPCTCADRGIHGHQPECRWVKSRV